MSRPPDRPASRREMPEQPEVDGKQVRSFEWQGTLNGQTLSAVVEDPDQVLRVVPIEETAEAGRGAHGAALVDAETGDVVCWSAVFPGAT